MDNKIRYKSLPNSLRWLTSQKLLSMTPWHFINDISEYSFASKAFKKEDINNREVFVFANRQDCDDFAGLEVIENKITDKVIYFHPTFSSTETPNRDWDIVDGEYTDVFDFISKVVCQDMRDWALTEDAENLD